jgi:osmoprotectant transport system permease protein
MARATTIAAVRSPTPLLLLLVAALLCPLRASAQGDAAKAVQVGSKRFTESYILGELARQALQQAGVPAVHRPGLGNTAILAQALAAGAVDVYPEYTGTITRELLQRPAGEPAPTLAQLNAWLAPRGWKAAVPLGFNNTYALAMTEARAQALGVDSLSALARLPAATRAQLRWGLSHEFLQRADGWPGLRRAYGFADTPAAGLDHGLAYRALSQGQVDVIDVYTTDAQVGRLKLRVLTDDRHFFPRYDAVLLMRATLDERPLQAALAGRIDERTMAALNAEAEVDGRAFADIARDFLAGKGAAGARGSAPSAPASSPHAAQAAQPESTGPQTFWQRLFAPDLGRLLGQHLAMVFASLALALVAGLPLGLLAFRSPRLGPWVMGATGVLQTVPSLALLAFLVALAGRIGFVPALGALSLYALLPIVRNTQAGLAGVPDGLRAAGVALGLRPPQVLRLVELPLALPTLMAGVKTAAVINVGTATVAAFVGAGGLGERIVAGLAVSDSALTLAGAVPSAALALVVQGVFAAVERLLMRAPRAG